MNKAGKHGMDTLQTMQKRSGIYQDRVDGKLPMDRVKGHYAQARLSQDASDAAKNKPTVTGTAIVKGTTYKKYSDGRFTMTKDGNTTSSSKTAYVGAKKSTSSNENKKISQADAKNKRDAQTAANNAKKASSDRNDANAAKKRAEVAEAKALGVKPGQKTDFEIVAKGKKEKKK